MANALVSSRLDCCNSLFRSLSIFNMCKIQYIQDTLARIVINCSKYTQAYPICKQRHWLPVESQCIFTGIIPVTLVPFCLLFVEAIVQATAVQITVPWRFLNSIHLYMNSKNTLATALLSMLPQFRMIYLMRPSLP